MGLLNWLFGASKEQDWQPSENGNPVRIVGRTRLTVFQSDGGWKYCIADVEKDDPYFSDPYQTEAAAKHEALAHVSGIPSKHRSLYEDGRDRALLKWEAAARGRLTDARQLADALREPNLNVTALRKIEGKIATRLRSISWQVIEFQRRGVSDQAIEEANAAEKMLSALDAAVKERIAEAKRIGRPQT